MADSAKAVVLLVLAAALLAGCGGGQEPRPVEGEQALTVWSQESQPARVRATQANVETFTRTSGIEVELVVIGEDELDARVAEARRTGRLPDVLQLPMASAHA